MRQYILNSDKILQFDLKEFVSDEIIELGYNLMKKGFGQFDGSSPGKYKKSNRKGFQSFGHNFLYHKKHLNINLEYTFNKITDIVNNFFDTRFSYKLNNYWFNISPTGASNEKHNHINPDNPSLGASGVLYLSTPNNSGNIIFYSPDSDSLEIVPEKGNLLLFPLHLEHSVQENYSTLDRISIAFNYDGFVISNNKTLL